MLRKLMTFVAVIAFVEGTKVQYPPKNPCILLDIQLNNTLTRNKTDSVPTFSLDGASVPSGKCEGIAKHSVTLQWADDGATIQMAFVNNTGSVSLMLTFAFVPFKVWNTGSNETVIMSGTIDDFGQTGKSFMCKTSQMVTFNETKDKSGTSYEAEWTFLNVHAQAFDVENGTFSAAEHCAGDQTTTEPTTHATNGTTEHTTHATNGTTEHTTHATNGTTEHTKPTTENGTTEHPTTITTHPTTENGTTEPTNSSTEAPTTMTTAPVTTKIPPANHPKNTYTFNNTGTKGGHCVRMTAQILFKINYPGGAKPAEIDIPDESKYPVKVSGDCNYTGMGLNMMKIEFRNTWSIQIVFSNSKVKSEMLGVDDDNSFWWKDVTLNYTYDGELFPGVWKNLTGKTETVYTNFSSHQYAADTDGSYICNSDTTLELSKDVKMETWDLQYFAFENRTDFNKDKVSQCTADSKTNSVVPIAVGAALAGLVVIVLIAYLIGRRRNRKGYESV